MTVPSVNENDGDSDSRNSSWMIEGGYWLSFNSFEGPGCSCHSDGFMVSVVLDAGSSYNFSGIKIVIGYKETGIFNNLLVRECVQVERLGIVPSSVQPRNNRNLIMTQQRRLKERTLRNAATRSPIFTIHFEVVLQRMDDRVRAILEPRGTDFSMPLRIAYEETLPFGSLVRIFESNVSFRDFEKDLVAPHEVFRLCGPPRGLPTYSTRIVPVARRAQFPYDLTPSILQSIARAAIDHQTIGWRAKLLWIGLVCKTWSSVLDTFFVLLTSDSCPADPPNPFHVSHSLEVNPERGLLMQCFRLHDYAGLSKGIDNEDQFINRCRAILTILSYAKMIKSIHLPGIHKSLEKEFVHTLSSLGRVESCKIYDIDSHMGKISDFTIGEIQKFIANWANLRQLEIAFRTRVSTSAFDDDVPDLQCRISNLTLRSSHLTGRQFIRFASLHLHTVELERIKGPNNRDLHTFLSIASPSLACVRIRDCEFKFQTAGEEYAIDEAMPKLCALEELTASGKVLSSLAIARKAPGRYPRFTATLVQDLYLDELADSLETTGWKVVTIKVLTCFMDDDDLVLKQEAHDTATRKNIVFSYEPLFS